MNTRNLHPGDEIEANVKGRRFHAIIERLDDPAVFRKPVRIRPLARTVTYRYVSARQIVRLVRRATAQMEIA